MQQDWVLTAQGVCRSYENGAGVEHIQLRLRRGEIVGLLGPNGAGKTTTLKLLSGVLAADAGAIAIMGYDLYSQPKQAKSHLGYMPEQPALYRELTVTESLRAVGQLYGLKGHRLTHAIDQAIDTCQLQTVTQRLTGHLSKGYQQRLGLAQAIIHQPSVIILDEPTAGLDPSQTVQFRQWIRQLATDHCVLLSSHLLTEVAALCQRVVVLVNGRIIAETAVSAIAHSPSEMLLDVAFTHAPDLAALQSIAGVISVETTSQKTYRLSIDTQRDPRPALLQMSLQRGWELQSMQPYVHDLEQFYLDLLHRESKER